jgi:hypothetical protein
MFDGKTDFRMIGINSINVCNGWSANKEEEGNQADIDFFHNRPPLIRKFEHEDCKLEKNSLVKQSNGDRVAPGWN